MRPLDPCCCPRKLMQIIIHRSSCYPDILSLCQVLLSEDNIFLDKETETLLGEIEALTSAALRETNQWNCRAPSSSRWASATTPTSSSGEA